MEKQIQITELMIDNWVKPIGSFEGVYARVISIDPDRISMITTGGDPHHGTIDSIEAIPITEEFLLKNGFHVEWNEDLKYMVCKGIIIEIGNNYKRYEDGEVFLLGLHKDIYFVHQLQNAFNIIGINKKIIP